MTWKEYFRTRLNELKEMWNNGIAIYDERMHIKEEAGKVVVRIDYCGEMEIEQEKLRETVIILEALITTARFWKELAEHYESKYDELKQELKQEQEQEQKGGDEPPF